MANQQNKGFFNQQAQNIQPKPGQTGNLHISNVTLHDKPISSPDFVDGTPEWVKPIIQNASTKHNIPTMLLSALLKQESNFNPQAKSPVGAMGIAQFMPETAKGMGVNPNDPESAINGAAQYLRKSWDKYGDPKLAVGAYNAGGGAIDKYGGLPPYPETQNYVKNIFSMASLPHQSANGPYLDTMNQIKKQNTPQVMGTSTGMQSSAPKQNPFPNIQSPIPYSDIVTPTSSPIDLAVQKIRRAKPNLSLSDGQLKDLYGKYGDQILPR
jgi:hypothetical protein